MAPRAIQKVRCRVCAPASSTQEPRSSWTHDHVDYRTARPVACSRKHKMFSSADLKCNNQLRCLQSVNCACALSTFSAATCFSANPCSSAIAAEALRHHYLDTTLTLSKPPRHQDHQPRLAPIGPPRISNSRQHHQPLPHRSCRPVRQRQPATPLMHQGTILTNVLPAFSTIRGPCTSSQHLSRLIFNSQHHHPAMRYCPSSTSHATDCNDAFVWAIGKTTDR